MLDEIIVDEEIKADDEYYNSRIKDNNFPNPYNVDFSKLNNFIDENTEIYMAPEKHRRSDISILIPKGMDIFDEDKVYVYELFNANTGEVIYYGESFNPYRRYVRHLNDIRNRYAAKAMLDLVDSGVQIMMRVITKCDSEEEALELETELIEDNYDTVVNYLKFAGKSNHEFHVLLHENDPIDDHPYALFKIVNNISGKTFFGVTKNFNKRRYFLVYLLNHGKFKNEDVQFDYNKYNPIVEEDYNESISINAIENPGFLKEPFEMILIEKFTTLEEAESTRNNLIETFDKNKLYNRSLDLTERLKTFYERHPESKVNAINTLKKYREENPNWHDRLDEFIVRKPVYIEGHVYSSYAEASEKLNITTNMAKQRAKSRYFLEWASMDDDPESLKLAYLATVNRMYVEQEESHQKKIDNNEISPDSKLMLIPVTHAIPHEIWVENRGKEHHIIEPPEKLKSEHPKRNRSIYIEGDVYTNQSIPQIATELNMYPITLRKRLESKNFKEWVFMDDDLKLSEVMELTVKRVYDEQQEALQQRKENGVSNLDNKLMMIPVNKNIPKYVYKDVLSKIKQ